MAIPFEELLVLILLLLGVVGIYYALKFHYIFAFGLVKNTSLSPTKKEKIHRLKSYILFFLKFLLFLGFSLVFVLSVRYLLDGHSLKILIFEWWNNIEEGFWVSLLGTLVRIALLIVISRYILKYIYAFLDSRQQKSINKKVYNDFHVKKVYLRIKNTIKYTVVLFIMYRITSYFPFLEEITGFILISAVGFFVIALAVTIREIVIMRGTHAE